jgi:hypothetical protein
MTLSLEILGYSEQISFEIYGMGPCLNYIANIGLFWALVQIKTCENIKVLC